MRLSGRDNTTIRIHIKESATEVVPLTRPERGGGFRVCAQSQVCEGDLLVNGGHFPLTGKN